jgi:acyl-CoA dehydrogenase
LNVFNRLDAALKLPPDEAMLVESVRKLAAEVVAPSAEQSDRSGEFPHANVQAINALGLNAMFIPEAYGGAQMSYAAYLECVRELSKACASTGIVWATNFHAIKPLIDFGTDAQKKRLLPVMANGGIASLTITEPTAGSDATGMKTEFRPDGDSIVVNGTKTFITNGAHADLYMLFGKWSEIADSKGAISVLVLEKGTPGLKVGREEDKMGLRASSTAALAFDNCRVPRANLLGNPGDGLKIMLASLNKSRPSVAAHALGIARAAFEDAISYINERRQSGARSSSFRAYSSCSRHGDRSRNVRSVAVARCAHGRRGRRRLRRRGVDAQDARLGSRDANRDRCGAALRRLRLLQGLSCRAPDARRENHPDLGRHESDPPAVDRPEFHKKVRCR